MDKFVVGFAYNLKSDKVLLIEKNKPEWQKGCLNGVGGKIEEYETPLKAMSRECREETGLDLKWLEKGIMRGLNTDGKKFICFIFYSYSDDIFKYQRMEDEEIHVIDVTQITYKKIIPNILFLIHFGICNDHSKFISIEY